MIDPTSFNLVTAGTRVYGRLPARPDAVNPLDEFSGLQRRLRRLRLKEWIGFTLIHPDLYASLIIQDAHYLASSEVYVFEIARGRLHEHASTMLGGGPALPVELAGSAFLYSRPGHLVRCEFGTNGSHRVAFQIEATAHAPALSGELSLDEAGASVPLSLSSRLPGGAMYTHKRVYRAAGFIHAGDARFVFESERDLAIIDEHRSFLPYRTRWLWGTFARMTPDGVVGANLVSRPELRGEPQESCVWSPGGLEPLSEICFAPESADPLAPWHICSADGRLDVRFEPEGRKDVRHQLVLAAIDYFQLFGRYTGTVRGADRTHRLRAVHGVCESMLARF